MQESRDLSPAPGATSDVTLSVVIPVYGGARTIGPLVESLREALSRERLQVVLVNDASPDDSHAVCLDLQRRHPALVTYVRLARNFGEHNAVMAGLHHARGEHVAIMDDDFQNPPGEVLRMLDAARDGRHEVVYSRYAVKKHAPWRNLGSWLNDRCARFMLDKPAGLYLSSFKVISRFVASQIVSYRGPYPYVDGLILRATRSIGVVEVAHHARAEGESGYTLRKLVQLWSNMFINFSVMPLRVATVMGFLSSLLAFLLGAEAIVERLVWGTPLGYASLIVTIVFFAGVQLLVLGLVGEYVGRLFLSSNATPQFVVYEVHDQGARR